LAKTSSEIFTDKVNLIYEYNKKSPLFVRKANSEIENNNVERAVEILNFGIKLYPGYAAAWLILGKALTLVGNYDEALNAIKTGSNILHSKKTFEFYSKEVELIKKQRSLFRTTRRSAFAVEEDPQPVNYPGLFEEVQQPEIKKKEPGVPVDDRLDQLASQISSAKIPPVSKDTEIMRSVNYDSFSNEGKIISETLAKIYIAQGEYNEAINVYEKLKLKNPKNADYFESKISELKNQPDA
jgi:tetratricopeptide (TPR) repeat protein